MSSNRPSIAIVSPTLDVMGGTEQIVGLETAALMEHADITFVTLASENTGPGQTPVIPVKAPSLPGVFGTEAWFRAATHAIKEHPGHFDAIYSPGMNCACATHINVYANFTEWHKKSRGLPIRWSIVEAQRRLRFQRLAAWERKIYTDPSVKLGTISHLAAERLKLDFGRDDVTVFPSTPEPGRFTPEARKQRRGAARKELGLRENQFAVVTLGNAWHSKGYDLLYSAWTDLNLPDAELLIVSIERPAHLKKMLGPVPDHVRFLPRQRSIEDLYAAADLVILASRGETFGLPIAEAGAMGTPVLVSEHAGVSGYLPESIVVKPNSAEAWKEAIQSIALGETRQDTTAIQDALQKNGAEERGQRFVEWILAV